MPSSGQLRAPPSGSVFVGRRRELDLLRAALEDARAGHPRVVAVEGPAGIGKTALVERFLAEAEDVTALRASGDASETDFVLGVVDHLLRHAGEAHPDLRTEDH